MKNLMLSISGCMLILLLLSNCSQSEDTQVKFQDKVEFSSVGEYVLPYKIEPTLQKKQTVFTCTRMLPDLDFPYCETVNYGAHLNTTTSSLNGICNFDIEVTANLTTCWGGSISGGNGALMSIVITDAEIDWDQVVLDCPDLPLPSNPIDQIAFLEDLEVELIEIYELTMLYFFFQDSSNGLCGNTLFAPVQTTRVSGACYSWCEVIGMSSTESRPLVVRKTKCSGLKCCQRTRDVCVVSRNPLELDITDGKITLLHDSCTQSSACDGNGISDGCSKDCKELF